MYYSRLIILLLGHVSYDQCLEIKKESMLVINKAFANISFEKSAGIKQEMVVYFIHEDL